MLNIVINDCEVEVTPIMKGSGMAIHHYDIYIVGYETFEITGQREFGAMVKLIEDMTMNAMACIDSIPSYDLGEY
jgi:hypothetical protein